MPSGIDGDSGEMARETSAALVTVTAVEPLTLPSVAETEAVPPLAPVTLPAEPLAFETVATARLLDCHVTEVVKSTLVPSE